MVAAVLCSRCTRVGPVRGCARCAEVKTQARKKQEPTMEPGFHLVKIDAVTVSKRYRKSVGDLRSLSKSMEAVGLLQPIVVSTTMALIAGERRLKAAASLGWTKIHAKVVDLSQPVVAEHDENEERLEFSPSERVEIARAKEREIGNRQGQRATSRQLAGSETKEEAAKEAGFSSTTQYRRAETVVDKAIPEVVEMMDSGAVPISAAEVVAKMPPKEQKKVVAGGAPKIKEAAAATRKRKKREAVTKRPDQPIIPKTVPVPKAATKKCRPTDPDALFALESAEWCRDQLKEVGRRLDDLARGPFGAMVRDQHEWFEDPEPVFLHEKKAQDPDARRGVVDVYTCSALTCMELLFWNVARDLIESHGTEEVEEEIEV